MEFLQYIREHELLSMPMLRQLCESVSTHCVFDILGERDSD